MTIAEYTVKLRIMCASYGFTSCPLFSDEIVEMFLQDIDLDTAYGICCDVNSGFDFNDCLASNLDAINAE